MISGKTIPPQPSPKGEGNIVPSPWGRVRVGLKDSLLQAKKLGFSDKQLSILMECEEEEVRDLRKKFGVLPVFKQIDTLAAEYPAETNYLYSTYHGTANDIEETPERDEKKIMILGSGPDKIGSSVEFDWCCVTTAKFLRQLGYKVVMVN